MDKQRRKNAVIGYVLMFTVIIMAAVLFKTIVSLNKDSDESPSAEGENITNAASDPSAPVKPVQLEPSGPDGSGRVSIHLDNIAATDLFNSNIPENLPISKAQISFYEPSGAFVDAVVSTSDLIAYAEAKGASGTDALRLALKVLPASADMTADITVFSDGKGGISVEPVAIEIGGFNIPENMIPRPLVDAISKALSDSMHSAGVTVDRITITDSAIEIEGLPVK